MKRTKGINGYALMVVGVFACCTVAAICIKSPVPFESGFWISFWVGVGYMLTK